MSMTHTTVRDGASGRLRLVNRPAAGLATALVVALAAATPLCAEASTQLNTAGGAVGKLDRRLTGLRLNGRASTARLRGGSRRLVVSPAKASKLLFVAANLSTPEARVGGKRGLYEQLVWLRLEQALLAERPRLTVPQVRDELKIGRLAYSRSASSSGLQTALGYQEVNASILNAVTGTRDARLRRAAATLSSEFLSDWASEGPAGERIQGRPPSMNDASAWETRVIPTLEQTWSFGRRDVRARTLYDESPLARAARVKVLDGSKRIAGTHPQLATFAGVGKLITSSGAMSQSAGKLQAGLADQFGRVDDRLATIRGAITTIASSQDVKNRAKTFEDQVNSYIKWAKDDKAQKEARDKLGSESPQVKQAEALFKGAGYLIASLIGSDDPQAGKRLQKTVDATVQTADAFLELGGAIANLTVDASMGNIVGAVGASVKLGQAVGNLLGIFNASSSSEPPKPEQVILDQIADLRTQVGRFRKEMNNRFDRIEQGLQNLYTAMTNGLDAVNEKLGVIQGKLDDLESAIATTQLTLQAIEREIQRFNAQAGMDQFYDIWVHDLRYRAKNPGAPPLPYTEYLRDRDSLVTYATQRAFEDFAAGTPPTPAQLDDDQVRYELSFPLDQRVNYLSAFAAKLGDGPFVTTSRSLGGELVAPSPALWAASADAFAELAAEWPGYEARSTNEMATAVARVGENLGNDLASIASHPDLFDHLLGKYEDDLDAVLPASAAGQASTGLLQWLDTEESQFQAAERIDPYGTPDQKPTGTAPLPAGAVPTGAELTGGKISACAAGTALDPPADVSPLFPQAYLNARYLGVLQNSKPVPGHLTICYKPATCRYHRGSKWVDPSWVTTLPLESYYDGKLVRDVTFRADGDGSCPDPQAALKSNQGGFQAATDAPEMLSAFRSIVVGLLRGEQSRLYGKIAGDLAAAESHNREDPGLVRLSGAKLLVSDFIQLGLPRALESDDLLRSLIEGGSGILDDGGLIALYRRAQADPPRANPKSPLRSIAMQRLNALKDKLSSYLPLTPATKPATSSPLIDTALLRLRLARFAATTR